MNNYYETLKKFGNTDLDFHVLDVAHAVYDCFPYALDITPEQFEKLCTLVGKMCEACVAYSIPQSAVDAVFFINSLIIDESLSLDELIDMEYVDDEMMKGYANWLSNHYHGTY